jgi:hypothetical protein
MSDTIDNIKTMAIEVAAATLRNAPISLPPFERMKLAIDAYEAAMIWPIADAPLDGTPVLTLDTGSNCHWCQDYWDTEGPGKPDWSICPTSTPTHFRPLPPTPEDITSA